MNAPSTDQASNSSGPDQQRGVRRTTLILLVVIGLLLVWYLVSDRLTPYTASARLKAYVVAVVPDVSGYVTEVMVKKDQLAEPGTVLFQIDTSRFDLAIEAAEAALELAGQDVGASTANVATATAKLSSARTKFEQANVQGARIFALVEKGIMAKAKGDAAHGIIETARSEVSAAEAELERAKQQLGGGGKANNPRVRRAVAALEEARLNYVRTALLAPTRGYVGGLKIDEGAYAVAGQAAMTFISVDDIWVEAYMTENNLGRIDADNKVEVAFDVLPGKIFEGKVKSIAVGVSTGKNINLGDLPTAQKARGWLRDPQRFPVIIQLTNYKHKYDTVQGIRLNSQADVIVYTGDHFFWNAVGRLWIRLNSWLSYAY
jgi:multidrug resistance efflux pump